MIIKVLKPFRDSHNENVLREIDSTFECDDVRGEELIGKGVAENAEQPKDEEKPTSKEEDVKPKRGRKPKQ